MGMGMGRGRVGKEAGRAPGTPFPRRAWGEGAVPRRAPDGGKGLGALCAEAASPSGLGEGRDELCETYRSLPGKGVSLSAHGRKLLGGPRL